MEKPWTPERLVKYINNYGLEEPVSPTTKEQYKKDILELSGSPGRPRARALPVHWYDAKTVFDAAS